MVWFVNTISHAFSRLGLRILFAWGIWSGVAFAGQLPPSFSAGSSHISPWVHRDSGFSFPASVAGFVRGTPNQYDTAGQDVSVGYDYFKPRIVATFYVYPTEGKTQGEEFLRRQREVTTMYPAAQLVSTGTAKVTPKELPAMIATYAIPKMFEQDNQPMRSLLLVGQRGDRFIEYRISFPVSGGEAATKAAQDFLAEFAWP